MKKMGHNFPKTSSDLVAQSVPEDEQIQRSNNDYNNNLSGHSAYLQGRLKKPGKSTSLVNDVNKVIL